MIVLVCGDRNWNNFRLVEEVLKGLGPNTVIVHGAARGADSIAGFIAKKLGYPVRPYPADWNAHGKAAGPIRNRKMYDTEKPELVIAFHNDLNSSKGTKDMVSYARSRSTPVNVVSEDE